MFFKKNYWIFAVLSLFLLVGIGVGLWFALKDNGSKTEPDVRLLVKTKNSIQVYDPNSKKLMTILENHIYGITVFDYFFNETIYYSTTKPKEVILSYSHNYPNLTKSTKYWTKTAIAVDNISKKVYALDKYANQVYVIDMKNQFTTTILSNLDESFNIALDPAMGLMFILQRTKILQCGMDGSNLTVAINNPSLESSFTIDRHNKIIYFVSSDGIKNFNYRQGTQGLVLSNRNTVTSISAIENKLYFLDTNDKTENTKIVMMCTLKNEICSQLNFVFSGENLESILAYDTRPSEVPNPCAIENGGCNELCLLAPHKNYTCINERVLRLSSFSRSC